MYPDDSEGLESINDIRNGMLISPEIHQQMGKHCVAVFVTPNCILDMDDIPPKAKVSLSPEVEYPPDRRYTIHWLKTPVASETRHFDQCTDAAFRRRAMEPKPSILLLAYIYGAVSVKRWGHNWKYILSKRYRPDLCRPQVSEAPPMGPSTIGKRETHPGDNSESDGLGGIVSGPGEGLDAGDFVALCWANNPVALERRRLAGEKFWQEIRGWATGVSR
ncbi:hypothetical protein K439DRAFT_1659964 [Ramaria rubella]|nr:hypothetical protein K439DRAFT_1659964 [Ramaria rubella]